MDTADADTETGLRPHGILPAQRVVTLDGPSGSGKSTVGRSVARTLGWRYVDTGATYRAATLAVLRARVPLDDAAAVTELVSGVVARGGIDLDTHPDGGGVRLDGEDVSTEIRSAPVTAAVSEVSAVPEVRRLLVDLQRRAIGTTGAVAEGRDVGTVVAPAAAVKIYLDADEAVRAQRRAADADSGVAASGAERDAAALLARVAADLRRRDAFDSARVDSPLRPADQARRLDATAMRADEVVARILQIVQEAGLA
ncbi:MAG: Cytidylate kinase [Frankiales bacterium]|nr:Cytidylate kinase [Frankiales bacterium]